MLASLAGWDNNLLEGSLQPLPQACTEAYSEKLRARKETQKLAGLLLVPYSYIPVDLSKPILTGA
eukprot:scaffold442270_cov19-Prasinocladus_malaysianus.AAC.1